MNSAGLIFVLTGVSGGLGMAVFQDLVTDGSISQGELDGTRKNVSAALATLKKTPGEKVEAMVAQYDDELSSHLAKFNSAWGQDPLGGFREAQVMEGYVTSIMNKSGIRG
jgi:hypothetical protein